MRGVRSGGPCFLVHRRRVTTVTVGFHSPQQKIEVGGGRVSVCYIYIYIFNFYLKEEVYSK